MPNFNPNSIGDIVAEWFKHLSPYLYTMWLSIWGGTVSHVIQLRKTRRKFKWKELFFDVLISSFAGIVTYFMCEFAGITGAGSAALIAISGHMGARALASFEAFHSKIFGKGIENETH